MTPILDFQNISRSFKKGVPVLKGVNFSMAEGEVVGLLGRNGAGKTTLIRIAMGMLFPAFRLGARVRPLAHRPARRREETRRVRGRRSDPPGRFDDRRTGRAASLSLRHVGRTTGATTARSLRALAVVENQAAQQRPGSTGRADLRGVPSARTAHSRRAGRRARPGGAPRVSGDVDSIAQSRRHGDSFFVAPHDGRRAIGRARRAARRWQSAARSPARSDSRGPLRRHDPAVGGGRQRGDRAAAGLPARASGVRRLACGIRRHAGIGAPAVTGSLGLDGVRCVSVPLEELFVELVGSNRPVEVS